MAYDNIETGRVKDSSIGSAGDLRVTLTDIPEGDLSDCTVHLPACLDFRPSDGKGDAIYAANGDLVEVLNVDSPAAKKKISQKTGAGQTAKGEARILSLGDNPNAILLKDTEFKIGTEAQKAAVRVDDEVDSGTLTAAVADAPSPPAPPLTKLLTIVYTDQFGAISPLLTMTFTAGLLVATVPAAGANLSVSIKGKPVTGSNLVKIE